MTSGVRVCACAGWAGLGPYDARMEAIRAVGVVFAVLFGFWGLPVAWQHWSRERRLAALVERNGKVLEQLAEIPDDPALPAVRMALESDTRRAIVRLASLKALPTPWPFWVAYGFAWLSVVLQVLTYLRVGATWQFLVLTALSAVILLWANHMLLRLRGARMEWVRNQCAVGSGPAGVVAG